MVKLQKGETNFDEKITAIDGLRGIAAIAIACIFHLATVDFGYPDGLPLADFWLIDWIYRRGSLFVELFLVISGYISYTVYTPKIDRGMSFPQYTARRAVRIYPLMIITLLLSAIGSLLYFFQHEHTWWWGGGGVTL